MVGAEILVLGGEKLTVAVLRKLGSTVIERWTRHRATKFFEAFVETLSAEQRTRIESSDTNDALDAMLDSDVKSEVLFNAYRRLLHQPAHYWISYRLPRRRRPNGRLIGRDCVRFRRSLVRRRTPRILQNV